MNDLTGGKDRSTIFIIDDDPSARKGLRRLIQASGKRVETFGSAEEFLQSDHQGSEGCIILDLKLPGLTGMELQTELNKFGYHLPIVFISGHGDIPTATTAIKQGAVNFLTKPIDRDALFQAIEEALKSEQINRQVYQEKCVVQSRVETLSRREHEVMTYVIAGSLNKQIAATLGIAEDTVKKQRGRMMSKMGIESVAELVRMTVLAGIKPAS